MKSVISRDEILLSQKIANSLNTMIEVKTFLGDLKVTQVKNNTKEFCHEGIEKEKGC